MRFSSALIGLSMLSLAPVAADAAVLNMNLTTDNQFKVYVSTDDTQIGTFVGSGNAWETTWPFSYALGSASSYYIHVVGTNWTDENGFPYPRFSPGNPDAFIGSFNISGGGFVFGNGLSTISTDTTYWKAVAVNSDLTWTMPTSAPQSFGPNGTSPWGSRPGIDPTAQFIWSNPDNRLYADFSVQITAVPEASTWAMMIIGFFGLGFFGYRKSKTAGATLRVA